MDEMETARDIAQLAPAFGVLLTAQLAGAFTGVAVSGAVTILIWRKCDRWAT